MNIDEKIGELNPEKQGRFYRLLLDALHDRWWCKIYEIDYVNIEPHIPRIKEIIYKNMFEKELDKV